MDSITSCAMTPIRANAQTGQSDSIWTIDQLPPLKVGDCLAFKAQPGFEQWAVGLEGALTWHWALAGIQLPADQYGGPDYEIIGSINKGVAQELLSAYQHRHIRVYRPDLPEGEQDVLAASILKRYAYYGGFEYNWLGVNEAALAYFLKYIGIKVHLPLNHRFYCIQFVCQVWSDFDLPLYDQAEPPTPYDLENTNQLKLKWGTF